jgi:hypothetical protein
MVTLGSSRCFATVHIARLIGTAEGADNELAASRPKGKRRRQAAWPRTAKRPLLYAVAFDPDWRCPECRASLSHPTATTPTGAKRKLMPDEPPMMDGAAKSQGRDSTRRCERLRND